MAGVFICHEVSITVSDRFKHITIIKIRLFDKYLVITLEKLFRVDRSRWLWGLLRAE